MTLNIFESLTTWFNSSGGDWEMISVILLVVLSALGGIWRFGIWFYNRRRKHEAEKDLHPFFSPTDIKKATQFYVSTKFQSNPPSQFSELKESNRIVARERLIPFFLSKAFKPGKDDQRFYMILAGSGMGKTTFMLNLYLSYLRHRQLGRAKYKIKLMPLGYPDLLQHIDKIEDKENTILLLDGLDEDNQAVRRYKRRLDRIINKVQHFRVVVFTSRTQFFPSEEEEPLETGIRIYGSRQRFLTFAKMYIAPFDEKDIQIYLGKRFGRFQKNKKDKALQIVSQSPSLMVRPMILSYIDDLLEENEAYENVVTLYATVIKKWIEREGGRVPVERRKHFEDELYRFSKEVALNIYANRKTRNGLFITEKEINNFADKHEIKLEEMEMKSRSLLNRNMAGQYKFAHKSILEYFLAIECIENPKFADKVDFDGMDQARAFYREMLLSKVTIPYLQSMDKKAWCKLGHSEKLTPSSLEDHNLARVTELGLSEASDLIPISPLSRLKKLCLNETQVKDLQPIADFAELKHLEISGTRVDDLGPISEMNLMEVLKVDGCQIRNLQPVKGLENLRTLSIKNTEVESLAQVGGLGRLKELTISGTRIKDLEPLKKLKDLTSLDMGRTAVSSLNPIRDLKGLKYLSFGSCKVKSLSPLKSMTQLKELDLSSNPIGSFKLLKDLKRLQKIQLSEDQMTHSDIKELRKALPNCKFILAEELS
ncbi:MAG: leucine-rich repeat domain-containing protein [Bacteroidia bacterium]|nr:leucine-rich repeat domain-containing protein [Bacteroidia bacterium]